MGFYPLSCLVCILIVYFINLNIHVKDAILVTYSWEHLDIIDIILLAPCKKSLCVLLDICKQFSLDFQINFNSSKSKLIVFSNANDCDTSVLFNNQMISSVSSEQHLGHIIGNQVSQECIKSITNDFFKRVNVYMQYSNSLLVRLNTSYLKFLYVFIRKCTVGFFCPNMLKCFIPLGVNVSDAYWVFHIELTIICFTSFVTIYRSTDNYIYVF